jgi:hypothetical protein
MIEIAKRQRGDLRASRSNMAFGHRPLNVSGQVKST